MTQLSWLLPFDDGARERVRALSRGETPLSAEALWRIAHHDLPLTAAQSLARMFRAHASQDDFPDAFRRLRVGLIGQDTLGFLADALAGAGLRHGLAITAEAVTLASAVPMIVRGESPLSAGRYDFVLVLPGLDRVSPSLGPDAQVEGVVADLVADVRRVCDWVTAEAGATPIIGLCAPGVAEMQMSADVFHPWSERAVRRRFNDELAALAARIGGAIWDVDGLSARIGLERWRNDKQYFWAKQPFDLTLVMPVADSLARIFSAACGKARRVLVLDLDNTLWGGVVGDDGVSGLVVGEGGAAAEAYRAVQRVALDLKKRGVVLAVCSKNDDAVARRPFRELPDMLLRESDFAIFQANWDDKASNVQAIARALDLTTASLAFLDDNPAERERVRQMVPDVAVIEPGDDPSLFARRVRDCGYFDHLQLTGEDLRRADSYASSARRAEVLAHAGSYEDYLQSLQMVLDVRPFDEGGRQRIAQLINKSNQFNVTTRRYSVQDVAALEGAGDRLCLQARLADRFGDHGMISVLIVDTSDPAAWVIDTWLMSCRVLKRNVERAMLDLLVDRARRAGAGSLFGQYLPTSKNALVERLFPDLGFEAVEERSPGTWWRLDVANHAVGDLPLRVDACF